MFAFGGFVEGGQRERGDKAWYWRVVGEVRIRLLDHAEV